MSGQFREIKIRVKTGDGVHYLGSLVLEPNSTTVKRREAIAGASSDITKRPLREPFASFLKWKQGLQLDNAFDKSKTSDFLRYLERLSMRSDFLKDLLSGIQKGDTTKLEFDMVPDLRSALGVGRADLEFALLAVSDFKTPELSETKPAKLGARPTDESDLSNRERVTFALSAARGKPLSRLKTGDEIVCRFVEAGRAGDIEATVESMSRPPGMKEIQILVRLDDGRPGYVLEEEPTVMVKLAPGYQPRDESDSESAASLEKKIIAVLVSVLVMVGVGVTAYVLLF
ncbi:MAG: hypothetical protein KDK35_19945 [Leptospiraceae bacterium]|nr:hypothetical protein [Leptospiraceae bacterium]